MEKFVHKFKTFDEADEADYEYYRGLSGNEKPQILLELIAAKNPESAVMERTARIYPLIQR